MSAENLPAITGKVSRIENGRFYITDEKGAIDSYSFKYYRPVDRTDAKIIAHRSQLKSTVN